MRAILLVFLGGGVGSVLRFVLGTTLSAALAERWPVSTTLPLHTLCINILGSGIIGVVIQLTVPFSIVSLGMPQSSSASAPVLSDAGRMLLAVGFCGGFTTFSTFSLELLTLVQSGKYGFAVLYVFASVVGCLLATSLGVAVVLWWGKNFVR